MANFIFNIALGRFIQWYMNVDGNSPANSAFIVGLIASTGVEADDTLNNADTVSALVAGATNEATNTGYARKTLTDSDISAFSPDDTNNRADITFPDQTWTGVANDGTGAISDLFTAYDSDTTAGTDANIEPMSFHDFAVTPDGSDIVADIGTVLARAAAA